MQKQIIFTLTLVSIFSISKSLSQCEVNGGENIHLCIDNSKGIVDTGSLNATVVNGIPPFSFEWSINNDDASKYLDDIYSNSPTILDSNFPKNELLTFNLYVTDSIGNQCKDSVVVSYSNFASIGIGTNRFISSGDSLEVSSTWFGGFLPLNCTWLPNYNIIDTTGCNQIVYPQEDTSYTVTLIDSVGCEIITRWDIRVFPSSNTENKNLDSKLYVYPNPARNFIQIKKSNNLINGVIFIVNAEGKLVYQRKAFQTKNTLIDISMLSKGIYFLVLKEQKNEFIQKMVIESF